MMAKADVSIVPGRIEHAPFLARVIVVAFRSHLKCGFWDHLLGASDEGPLRYLEALTTTTTLHLCHYSTFLVAEVDGTPAAALSGYFAEEHGQGRLELGIFEASRATGIVPDEENVARARTILHVSPEHPGRTWILESVSTAPQFRRQGLIERLLEATLERARDRGATLAGVGVFIGNDPAQRAYEKAGFGVVAEKRHSDFEAVYGTPGMRTLRRAL